MNIPCQVSCAEIRNDTDDNVSEDYYHSQPQKFKGLYVTKITVLLLTNYAKGYFSTRQYRRVLELNNAAFKLIENRVDRSEVRDAMDDLGDMIACLPVDVIEEHLEKIEATYGVKYLYEKYGVSSPENV